MVESVLRPKHAALWRRMVSAGLRDLRRRVVAQGVQWTANALAAGLDCAGRLRRRGADRRSRRRFAGHRVAPSVATAASAPTNAMKRAICCTVTRSVKPKRLCRKLAQQAGLDQSRSGAAALVCRDPRERKATSREVVSLYAQLVQPVLDAQARREPAKPCGGGVER
ncbi:hypothetical protein LN650_18740 [Klebsiella pneumoniae subsp. pneumoniae]|nr:hypothetical protein [Klebsiella pneumoniae subsp. pneumoniae]